MIIIIKGSSVSSLNVLCMVVSSRAAVEEKYAKDLLGLSKKVCGHNEMK